MCETRVENEEKSIILGPLPETDVNRMEQHGKMPIVFHKQDHAKRGAG